MGNIVDASGQFVNSQPPTPYTMVELQALCHADKRLGVTMNQLDREFQRQVAFRNHLLAGITAQENGCFRLKSEWVQATKDTTINVDEEENGDLVFKVVPPEVRTLEVEAKDVTNEGPRTGHVGEAAPRGEGDAGTSDTAAGC